MKTNRMMTLLLAVTAAGLTGGCVSQDAGQRNTQTAGNIEEPLKKFREQEEKEASDWANAVRGLLRQYLDERALSINEWQIVFLPPSSLPRVKDKYVLTFVGRPPNRRMFNERTWDYDDVVIDRLTGERKQLFIHFSAPQIGGVEVGPPEVTSVHD